jgi:hypothetical protein
MPAAPVRAAFACLSRYAAVRMQVIRLPKPGWAVSLRVTEQIRVIDVIVELPGDRTARTTWFTDILPMSRSGRTIGHLEKLAAAPRYANLVIEDVILWSGSDGAAGVFRR